MERARRGLCFRSRSKTRLEKMPFVSRGREFGCKQRYEQVGRPVTLILSDTIDAVKLFIPSLTRHCCAIVPEREMLDLHMTFESKIGDTVVTRRGMQKR